MEYLKLFNTLYEEKIRYLICGGLAVNIYGIPRMTADIDLLVDFEEDNIKRFERITEVLAYKSLVPLKLEQLLEEDARKNVIRNKNLIAYSYYNTVANFMNVDVLIDVPISFDEMWTNREVRNIDSIFINIVSIQHLIAMKQYSNRNQDKADVLLLSKLIDKNQ